MNEVPGLAARKFAGHALIEVLHRRRTLDEAFGGEAIGAIPEAPPERDRALARMIAITALRRLGSLRLLLVDFLDRGVPASSPWTEAALLVGATQILFMEVPDHAAVDLSVRLASDEHGGRYRGMVNAVLRRIAREGRTRITAFDPSADTPSWLYQRWVENFGAASASAIAAAHRHEPPLDLSVKRDAPVWAERLGGRMLPTGSIRLTQAGAIADLPGYAEGAWWVQDAAAALPVRLFGHVRGKQVADLCAAPGGKTAQLAAAGATVVAVDRSEARVDRLRQNLARLDLAVETVVADAARWQAGPFDAVLLDPPCTATGTVRRHPDLPWRRQPEELSKLMTVQARLLDHAANLVRPGGVLVYSTCSLEPEENEAQVAALLARNPDLRRQPISASEIGGFAEFVSAAGDLRTLPCHLPDQDSRQSGCDGFYAARLVRQ